jgi:dolichyl-diphosphooligosaccharide--protein glycosyltransferase
MMLIYARSSSVSAGDFSLLQPLVAFGIAGGTAFLFGLSRYAERTGYERRYYPPFVGGLAVFALVLGRVMYPPSVDMLRQLITRVYSFGLLTSPTARTVREIHPASISDAISAFGLVFPVAIIGLLLLGYHVVREDRPVELLVVLWSLTMLSAYFTMVRFGYYLAVNIAVLATYAIWWIVTRGLALDVNLDNLRDVELHHVAVVVIVLVLIVPGNVIAMGIRPPVWEQAEGLGGTDRAWYDGLTWMKGNTPDVPMGYYEQYDRPADEDYDYPEGAYGVMSWWDYGHWITVMGHRIPYANPFQQGPRPASAFFQATNETRASLILEALPSIAGSESAAEMSVQALRDEVSAQSDQEASENGRYVVIDDQMAGGKFPAITQWAGPDRRTYFTQGRYQIRGQNVTLPETSERYGRTMLAKLYYDDASGLSHYRLVHEVDRYAIVGGYIRGQQVRTLTSLPLQGDWNGIASIASRIQQSTQEGGVVSLGQGSGQFVYNANVESRVKLYERVEGATLTGAVPDAQNGTPVYAILRLQTHTGRNFTYVQRTTTASDGTFRMTVPYATDDSVTPANGGTNSSVEALGAYSVRVGRISDPSAVGAIQVPEGAVYEGRKVQVPVEAIQQENQSTRAGDLSSSTFATDQPTRSVERRTPGLAVDTAS